MRISISVRQKRSQVVERLSLHVHFPKLALQVDERVEILVLLSGEVEDFVLGAVVVHLPFQRVRERIDLHELLGDEFFRLDVGGQTRLRRVIDVGRRQGVQEALRPVRKHVTAGHGDDACSFHVVRLQRPAVLPNAHGPRLDSDSEILLECSCKPLLVAR